MPTVSRLRWICYRNLRQRLTHCRSDQGRAVTWTGGRRGRERAGAVGKGTAREDGRDRRGRATDKDERGGQGQARRWMGGGENGRRGQGRAAAAQEPPPAQASVRAADEGSRPTAAIAGAPPTRVQQRPSPAHYQRGGNRGGNRGSVFGCRDCRCGIGFRKGRLR